MTEDDHPGRSEVTETPREIYEALLAEVGRVLIGNEDIVEGLTVSLLTGGHVLLEGVPGVAKTTLANLFAVATGLEYRRIQMTPDVLPADVTGTHIYRENTSEFTLHRGPVFANLVVADEINRATPKTQSALLEAMQERQVTIEGETLELPSPFMVVATQNPIEMEGVFELPEAQRDRFQQKLRIDLPARAEERKLLGRFDADPTLGPETVERVVETDQVLEARRHVDDVHVADPIKSYVLDVVGATRSHADILHGASPRASLAFLNASKARAAISGRPYVIPDDIKALAEPILVHRLVLSTSAELSERTADDLLEDILETVEPPGGDGDDLVPEGDDEELSVESGYSGDHGEK